MRGKKIKTNEIKNENGAGPSLVSVCSFMIVTIILSGAFYLYQVNDLATKGFEMREVENRIAELEKEGKKMEIKEVELRSMYSIEQSTKDLNLVNAQNVSYVEMASPVAMK